MIVANIHERTSKSTIAKFASNGLSLVVMFIRGIIFARLLEVETFGICAIAFAWIEILSFFCNFGIEEAFLNELGKENYSQDELAKVHFTLQIILSFLWLATISFFSCVLAEGILQKLLITLGITKALENIVHTPKVLLQKEVNSIPLAKIDIYNTALATIISVYLAIQGYEVLVLIAIPVVNSIVTFVVLYFYTPVWRPSFCYSKQILVMFLNYGFYVSLVTFIQKMINNIDRIWISYYLGEVSLGYYSNARRISQYPMSLFSSANIVFYGAYSNLQNDREALSKLFTNVMFYLTRTTFIVIGIVICIVPEFVIFALGEKWEPIIPIVPIILIMIIFQILRQNVIIIFRTMGRLKIVIWLKIIHFIFIGSALLFCSNLQDVVYFLVAIEIAMFIILLWNTSTYVDFEFTQIFLKPAIIFGGSLVVIYLLPLESVSLLNAIYRTSILVFIHLIVLYIWEEKEFYLFFFEITKHTKHLRKLYRGR